MFAVILLVFIFIPIIEISVLIQVGSFLGLWTTIALVLLTAVIGVSLVRSQGVQTLLTVQQRLEKGELPAEQIIEGVMIAVAGVLLLVPGFVTDTIGMLLLLPWVRQYLVKNMKDLEKFKFNSAFQKGNFHQSSYDKGDTFEGSFERKDDNDQNRLN